jgi:hypothetical protein
MEEELMIVSSVAHRRLEMSPLACSQVVLAPRHMLRSVLTAPSPCAAEQALHTCVYVWESVSVYFESAEVLKL